MAPETTAKQLQELLGTENTPLLLDVREDHEYQISHIPGCTHIPLHALLADPMAIEEYKDRSIVVYCRSGVRSLTAATFLSQNGFSSVSNLKGGITEWKNDVDPTIAVG